MGMDFERELAGAFKHRHVVRMLRSVKEAVARSLAIAFRLQCRESTFGVGWFHQNIEIRHRASVAPGCDGLDEIACAFEHKRSDSGAVEDENNSFELHLVRLPLREMLPVDFSEPYGHMVVAVLDRS